MAWQLLAQGYNPNIELFIPIVAIVIGGFIAVAAIMTAHQRKMAELIRKNDSPELLPALMEELKQIRSEMQTMRTELHQTTIAIDDVRATSGGPPAVPQDLSQRIHEEQL